MNPALLTGLLITVGVVLLLVTAQAIRRPVQRRFAVRDVMRRPGEAALVIVGSLLGTALIAGSFIVGDTLDASIRQQAWDQLGPVDEVVVVSDPERAGEVVDLISDAREPRIDGVMSFLTARAAVASDASGPMLAEPGVQLIELDFEDAQNFGGDPSDTGISGATPRAGRVVLIEDLADGIGVAAGDDVTLHLYGSQLTLTVDRVLPQKGLAGYRTDGGTGSPNAFVAPGTVAAAVEKGIPRGAVPPSAQVVVSNQGGVEKGANHSVRVQESIEDALAGAGSVRVDPIKSDVLEAAESAGDNLGSTFLTFGMFAIIAGILLLVNIFVMLAEERKSQLGMLRAVGTRRSDLIRIFIIEGVMYSLAAAVIGAVVGIGVGWAIVTVAAPIFSSLGDSALDFRFSADLDSILGGFSIGLLASVATIALTSVRISRINIIRAIRELPEPVGSGTRPAAVVGGTLVAVAAAGWFLMTLGDGGAWAPALLALPIAAFALVPLGGRLFGKRASVLTAATFGLGWGLVAGRILDGQMGDDVDLTAFVFQGVLLVFSSVVLLSQLQETFEGAIRRLAARRLPLRLGLAYPLARRFRTGLTLGMYSLVIFTLVMVGVMSGVFGGQVASATRDQAGGFNLLVTGGESNPPDAAKLEAVEGVERVVATASGSPLFGTETNDGPVQWPATGVTAEFTEVDVPRLSRIAPEFEDAATAWEEVLSNPKAMIVPQEFLQAGGGPPENLVGVGDEVEVIDPVSGRTTSRTVVGITEGDEARSGAFMSFDSLNEVLAGRASVTRFYLVASGSLPEINDLAARIEGSFVANGVEAQSFRSIVEDGFAVTMQFMRLIQGYLALGLIVGIAGLGVVMVRAVRDRRHHIGVLRALGFVPRSVRRAFLLESSFVALEGILVGTSLALVTANQMIAQGAVGESAVFGIPWMQLTIVCGVAFAASLLATTRPAQRASQIAPAVALRVAD
jgi:putative ABC transport system permease protein